MSIRVINVRGLNTPEKRAGIVYVGRGFAGWTAHPLANPYKPGPDLSRGRCLDRYRDWLLARPTLARDLAALWEQTEHGRLPLGCWCTDAVLGDGRDTVCHAQVLAVVLATYFPVPPLKGP